MWTIILGLYALVITFGSALVIIKLHKTVLKYKRYNLRYYLEKLLEELPASSVVTDSKGLIVYVNKAFADHSGYFESELIGQNISLLKSPADGDYVAGDLWKHIMKGEVWRGPFINQRKDGCTYVEEFIVFPVTDTLGDLYFCALGSNVINRYLENKELEQVQRQSIKFKENFISNLSHEVRTPLNAMIGLSQLGQKNDQTEKHQSYFTKINHSAKQLMQLMDDILDFSKIESGSFTLVNSRFNFMSLLTSLISQYGPKAAEKKLEFNVYMDEFTPQYLYADSFRLEQILSNLVSNAIKFTSSGEVSLTVRLNKSEGSGYHLSFKVSDTGIGMEPVQLKGIFNPFSQLVVDNQKRNNNSSGLGMAITKQIVDLMKGIIIIDSIPQNGTQVEVVIPFNGNDIELPSSNSQNTVEHLKVMVIDDAHSSRENAKYILEGFGYEVILMDSGQNALNYLSSRSEMDLILIDWHMPGMDGEETLTEIIKIASEGTRILFITPYGPGSISENSRRYVHGYLPKPYTASMLFDTIVTLFATNDLEGKNSSKTGHLFSAYRVMLVDDNPVNNLIAKNLFEQEGAKVTTFLKAQRALEYLKKHKTDFIVSDIDMPEMDGYEFLKAVKVAGYTLPVYALTANTSDANRQQIHDAGFDEYMSKPLTHEKLKKLSEKAKLQLPEESVTPLAVVTSEDSSKMEIDRVISLLKAQCTPELLIELQTQLAALAIEARIRKPKGCKEILSGLKNLSKDMPYFLIFLEVLQGELQRYRFDPMIEMIDNTLSALGGVD